jgi:hypothetical protein
MDFHNIDPCSLTSASDLAQMANLGLMDVAWRDWGSVYTTDAVFVLALDRIL